MSTTTDVASRLRLVSTLESFLAAHLGLRYFLLLTFLLKLKMRLFFFQFQAETSFGEFPWHVAIVNGETGDYLCAGTIISARFVITVAHCVRKFQLTLLFVRVGDWDLSSTSNFFIYLY